MIRPATLLLLILLTGVPASAEEPFPTVEVTSFVGYSTQDLAAGALDLRVFGSLQSGLRYHIEGAWAARGDGESDAFGNAFPYSNQILPLENYLEQEYHVGKRLIGFRAGQIRPPFGIYSFSDQSYNGFLRPPLIRYYDNWSLSNFWLDGGANLFVSGRNLQFEAMVGTPTERFGARRSGLDRVFRLQGYQGPFILGASYIRTEPPDNAEYGPGHSEFYGVDGRWMSGGMQIRGEWLRGSQYQGSGTEGYYVDGIFHKPAMGPVTAVARYEHLNWSAGPYSEKINRYVAGARVRITRHLIADVNVVHSPNALDGGRANTALDLGLTYTRRFK